MTTLPSAPTHPAPAQSATADTGRLLGLAASLGVALGVGDLLLQTTLPYPLANLANSSAVWALGAFSLAAWLRTTPARGALAGTTLLLVAVEAYYVAAVLTGRADVWSLWRTPTLLWLVFGVLAGVAFGVAGSWVRQAEPWRAAAGLAAASAVFFAEAGVRLLPGSGSGLSDVATILLTSALGCCVLLSAVGRPVHLARAVVLVGPLTLLGTMAFAAARF